MFDRIRNRIRNRTGGQPESGQTQPASATTPAGPPTAPISAQPEPHGMPGTSLSEEYKQEHYREHAVAFDRWADDMAYVRFPKRRDPDTGEDSWDLVAYTPLDAADLMRDLEALRHQHRVSTGVYAASLPTLPQDHSAPDVPDSTDTPGVWERFKAEVKHSIARISE